MDTATFLQIEYQYQGMTISGRELLECYCEPVAIELIQAASFTHGVKKRYFDDQIEIDGPDGEKLIIKASSVKSAVRGFINSRKLQGLWLSDDLQIHAGEFRDYLREKSKLDYRFIAKGTDLNWLYNICFLALVEYISDQKNKSNDFKDQRCGMLAIFAFGMRDVRSFAAEGHNHNMKNKYMQGNEDKEKQDKSNEEDPINKWCKAFEDLVEDLSKRGLPDFKLPELPKGIEVPLQLPMGTRKKAS